MALRPQFSLIHSEFNEFLFAPVGEEEHGLLTVLSALARLGVDPWQEAARLSDLPRAAAAQALAAIIAALPEGDWKMTDSSAIADRLVQRLPTRSARTATPPRGKRSQDARAKSRVSIGLICVVIAAAAFIAMLHFRAEHPSESAPNPVSSMQR